MGYLTIHDYFADPICPMPGNFITIYWGYE